ncbi:hypothetical protein J1N35_002480 [Gossypium stocksii]|uniref:Uncharacterized protein n=1 Tax=Gossypium stocksii TaxID=47602 RepID=A0A9D4AMH7_9ROSI|nr:hypothetical protein J1N35_002480 [Gossypium stocksii]
MGKDLYQNQVRPNPSRDVFIHVTGGKVGAVNSLAPKIGLLSLSPKKISENTVIWNKQEVNTRESGHAGLLSRTSTVEPSGRALKFNCPRFDGEDFWGWWSKLEQFFKAEEL